jgi:glutathione reductase (NADPH)
VAAAASNNGTGYDYDLFTIGAGSGGVRGSRFAASYGEPESLPCMNSHE